MKKVGLLLPVLFLAVLLSVTSYAQPIPGDYDSRDSDFLAGAWTETLVGGSEGAKGNVIHAEAADYYVFGDASAPALNDVIMMAAPTTDNRFYEYRTVYKGGTLTLLNNALAGWHNVNNDVATPYQVSLDNTLVVTKKYVDAGGALTGQIEFDLFVLDANITGYPGYSVTLTAKYDRGTPAGVIPSDPFKYGAPLTWAVITVTVTNLPPVAICRDVTVSADSTCTASASIDNGSFDPDGDPITLSQSPAGPYLLGITPVTLTVTDSEGASSECVGKVTAVDTTPPTITFASVEPSVLWPPNHKMVNVTVNYGVADNCSATCSLSVTSNEPVNGRGDGATSRDWKVVDSHHVKLRAERAGTGTGRIYTVTTTCIDGSGNTSSQALTVSVPKDQKKK